MYVCMYMCVCMHGEVYTLWFRRVLIRVELLVHINGIVNLAEFKGHQYNIYSVQGDNGRGQRSLSVVTYIVVKHFCQQVE